MATNAPNAEGSSAQISVLIALPAPFSVRSNPGWIQRQQRWLFYYLYSLERAARLSGVELLQGRDWYFEGSMVLAATQQQDGSWPSELHGDEEIERAAMAVLFLRRGTAAVLTPR